MKIALKKKKSLSPKIFPKPRAIVLGSQDSVGKDAKKLFSKETEEEQIQVICSKEAMNFACNSNYPEYRQKVSPTLKAKPEF